MSVAAAASAHSRRVTRLYRQALKTLFDYCEDRPLWISEGFALRKQFDQNKHLTDQRAIEKVVAAAEKKLAELKHPMPYILPTEPGGTMYQRYPNNGKGVQDDACRIPPSFITPEVLERLVNNDPSLIPGRS